MYKAIFAFDFSCNKPAMTSYINDVVDFYVWPSDIDDKSYDRLTSCGVNVFNRNLGTIKEKSLNQHELILEHVDRAINLSEIILHTIDKLVEDNNIKKDDVVIANEGFAFSAKGDAALQLAGYKYILMEALKNHGYKNLKTYSPITIKKTADCSKKGLGKDAMIEAMGRQIVDHHLISVLHDNPDYLKKKSNYVLCMDDIADSFWNLKTCMKDLNG
jgi:hypothetical protein